MSTKKDLPPLKNTEGVHPTRPPVPKNAKPNKDSTPEQTEVVKAMHQSTVVASDAGKPAEQGASVPSHNERGFPDIVTHGSKVTLLPTIDNAEHLLKTSGWTVSYEVISKKISLRVPELEASPENYDNVAITSIYSEAARQGLPTTGLQENLAVIADKNRINSAERFINSKCWDDQNRLQKFYRTLKVRDDYPEELRDILLYRWLIATVAAAVTPSEFNCRGVLVLQGPQSIGKTSWFARLLPDGVLRNQLMLLGHHLDIGDKDSKITAIRHWIVEIGELDSTFKKDIARLKAFLTNSTDKIRQPYARLDSVYQRRTVFCASVNEETFLVDPTGNSRWWTIPVVEIDYNHDIDMQQLFAQVLEDLQAGAQWWLTKDEEVMLTEYNRQHMATSSLREQLMEELDMSIPEPDRRKLSATQVLQMIGYQRPSNPQCRECGGILRDLLGDPKKINGTMKWAVPIMVPTL